MAEIENVVLEDTNYGGVPDILAKNIGMWESELDDFKNFSSLKMKDFDCNPDQDISELLKLYEQWRCESDDNYNFHRKMRTWMWQMESTGLSDMSTYSSVDYNDTQGDYYARDCELTHFDSFRYNSGTHPQDCPEIHYWSILGGRHPYNWAGVDEEPTPFKLFMEYQEWRNFNQKLFLDCSDGYADIASQEKLRCHFKQWCLMKLAYYKMLVNKENLERATQKVTMKKLMDDGKKYPSIKSQEVLDGIMPF